MISITLHSHPVKGQDTRFMALEENDWDREIIQHVGFGAVTIEEHSHVTTEEMLAECFEADNGSADALARSLLQPVDVANLWAEHHRRHPS